MGPVTPAFATALTVPSAETTVPIPRRRDQSWCDPATGGIPLTQGATFKNRFAACKRNFSGDVRRTDRERGMR